ncbi:hypothetical protein F6R98_01435 [Candidatus Methylospira mobilis]|uniref:Uncharacterized protein n=1 Tax=Candidatus Methylospira mobilis TaxID=1808979 RepID=A0A5Q0BD48_9GAMM|nr:hypothetical protein [Candidatus Methylospira mobilis]QFY41449.1 hypothetical protein F6R98_01435 [Candidatus Methylospira mobilis]
MNATATTIDTKPEPRLTICTALPKELAACLMMLDSPSEINAPSNDDGNQYWYGTLPSRANGNPHQVLITSLVKMGNNVAASAVTHIVRSFDSVEYILMVGIAGGIPDLKNVDNHVRLGDVVITNEKGIIQYDNIKRTSENIETRDTSSKPSADLINAAKALETKAILGQYPWETHLTKGETLPDFHRPPSDSDVLHDAQDKTKVIAHPTDLKRELRPNMPKIHLAAIGSGNTLLKDAVHRDNLRDLLGIQAIEMEGSGTADATWNAGREYIVIRGICDYCDEHKNNNWQYYAALVAAAYARALIENLPYSPPKRRNDIESFSTQDAGTIISQASASTSVSLNEYEQLRTQLEGVYAEKLESIQAMRGAGDFEAGWNMLETALAELAGSPLSQTIQARYYYHAARWAQEDGKPAKQHQRYYQAALRLDSTLDDRSYRAFEAAADKKIEEAIAILQPLDSESVVINLLKYLLNSGRCAEADEFIHRMEIPVTDEIRRFHALCLLAAGNANEAWQVFEPALGRQHDSPFFQLTAGYIAFWQAVPAGLYRPGSVTLQLFKPGLFSLNDIQNKRMYDALCYLEQALTSVSNGSKKTLKQDITDAYLAVCLNLPEKHTQAVEKAKNALAETPVDPIPIVFLMWMNTNYDWNRSLDALSSACEQPYPPSWAIEVLGELLVHVGQIDAAWKHLLRFEHRLTLPDERINWFDRAIRCLGSLGQLPELAERVAALADVIEYRRIKANFWVQSGEIAKALPIAEGLTIDPGNLLDHINLVSLQHKVGMWQELTVTADCCLKKFDEAPAHIAQTLAQAWMVLKKPADTLDVLNRYKQVFERDGQSYDYYAGSMEAYIAQGQYPQAWGASERLWQQHPDEQLLVQRAQLQTSMGDSQRAVEILKQGVELGFVTAQIFMLIAHYSLTHDREEAFEWAKRTVESYPNDPKLRHSAMQIGFNAGHSDWASMQMAILRRDFPDSGLFQEIRLPDLITLLREWQEHSATFWRQFINGQLPMHLWLDSQRGSFGTEFYWRWHDNRNRSIRQHAPFPMTYGGRSAEPLLKDWEGRSISMDYSACLMAHALTLFPYLDNAFDVIHIPPSLLGVIQQEIHQLKQIQPDRVEQAEKLLAHMETLKITFLREPDLETGDYAGLHAVDRMEWHLAEQNNLLIVTDRFATETFESGSIPIALEALRITCADIIAVMRDRGELIVDESQFSQFAQCTVDTQKIERLTHDVGLLVDRPFLELLMQLNGLEAAARRFKLYCAEGIHEQLRAEIENYRSRLKIENWLQSLRSELNRRLKNGKIKPLTLSLFPEERQNALPLTRVLEELFLGMEGTNAPIWIDDRLMGSYSTVSEQASIVGVHDILSVLHSRKAINDGKFLEGFRSLLNAGVDHRLPPTAYLAAELKSLKIEQHTGNLIENVPLTKLRETVLSNLASDSILSKAPIRTDLMPEESEYRLQLHRFIETTMAAIWTDNTLDEKRCIAMADWIYERFLPHRGRPVTWWADSTDLIQNLAIEHCFRMSLPWHFMEKPQATQPYYQWLFQYIEPAWRNHTTLRDAALTRFAELINEQLATLSRSESDAPLIQLITNPLRFLPDEVLNQLLAHPLLETRLKKYFITGIHFQFLNLFFSEAEWQALTIECINHGKNKPLHKIRENRKFTLEFTTGNGVGDCIAISGQAANGAINGVNVLSPYSRLDHPIPDIRVEWLDEMMQIGLLNVVDCDYYRSTLESDDFHTAVDDLRNRCERSGDYFFAFAGLSLEIAELAKRDLSAILPIYCDIFTSITPEEMLTSNADEWLFANTEDTYQTKRRFASLAALPFGPPWDIGTLAEQALSENRISTEQLSDMVDDLIKSKFNPIVLQNLLSICLRFPEADAQTRAESLTQTLLILEANPKTDVLFDIYIELLHLIWNHFQLTAEFKDYAYEQRVIWAYVYADRMLDSIQRQSSQNPTYLAFASKNLKEVAIALEARINPFDSAPDEDADVALPSAASRWRTVIGGALGVLKRNADALECIRQTVLDIVTPFQDVRKLRHHSKLFGFEFFALTDYPVNIRNSAIGNQGRTLATELCTKLSDELQSSNTQPLNVWLAAIEKEDIHFLVNLFPLIARYPVPTDIVDHLLSTIEVFIEKNSFSQVNKVLLLGIADLLGRLKGEQALSLREPLITKAINVLRSEPSLWSDAVDLSFRANRFDTPAQRHNSFVAMLGQIAAVLPEDIKEFSDFSVYIRRLEAYLPPEFWPKLWNLLTPEPRMNLSLIT